MVYYRQRFYLLIHQILFHNFSLHLFFLDKANIIRMSSLDLINTIVNFQIEIKLTNTISGLQLIEKYNML